VNDNSNPFLRTPVPSTNPDPVNNNQTIDPMANTQTVTDNNVMAQINPIQTPTTPPAEDSMQTSVVTPSQNPIQTPTVDESKLTDIMGANPENTTAQNTDPTQPADLNGSTATKDDDMPAWLKNTGISGDLGINPLNSQGGNSIADSTSASVQPISPISNEMAGTTDTVSDMPVQAQSDASSEGIDKLNNTSTLEPIKMSDLDNGQTNSAPINLEEPPVMAPKAEPVIEPIGGNNPSLGEIPGAPVIEPIGGTTEEPKIEPIAQPISEPIASAVGEPIVEPAVETFSSPVVEPMVVEATPEPMAQNEASTISTTENTTPIISATPEVQSTGEVPVTPVVQDANVANTPDEKAKEGKMKNLIILLGVMIMGIIALILGILVASSQ